MGMRSESRNLIRRHIMSLFLVTSLFDEGMYDTDFQVVEAESKLAITQHMIDHPQ